MYQDCIAIPNQGGNKEAYLGLIRAFRDNDHNFTDSEANTLDKLISNNRDELIKNPKDYADICYETGKLYWYYYQENANKLTSAINAKNWFGKVKEYAPDGYENRGTAEVYYAVGDFYSTITELQKQVRIEGYIKISSIIFHCLWNLLVKMTMKQKSSV